MYSKNLVSPTPPMGWNSYDYYNSSVTEDQIKRNADYTAKHLLSLGYEFIVIDIEWANQFAVTQSETKQYSSFDHFTMDEYGRLLPALNRFPSAANGAGFKPLADYIHNLGLKFGIHIMRGIYRYAAHCHLPVKDTNTSLDQIADALSVSNWSPHMYGVDYTKYGASEYYDSLFELYASWGVDFIKVDDIAHTSLYTDNPYAGEKEIELISSSIEKCGRPMVLSLSPGPAVIEKAWHLQKYANMWRITNDFWDRWELLKNMFERCDVWQSNVKYGCYPDCDMIPIGSVCQGFYEGERRCKFTYNEQKTMMTLWGIFRSPLILGGSLEQMTKEDLELITNPNISYLNKYSHGATQVFRDNSKAAWISFDFNSRDAFLAIFNLSDGEANISVSCKDLLSCGIDLSLLENSVLSNLNSMKELNLSDMWQKTNEYELTIDTVIVNLPEHGCTLKRLQSI